jgi:FkbH-like protein
MSAEVGYVDQFHASRVSQLINKSNQFHLTGKRYGEAEVIGFANDPASAALYFKLKDRFGDNGLVSAVVLREMPNHEAEIDTWVMSCRVLSRGMEQFICNEIVGELRRRGISKIHGLYIPTKKNKLVSALFDRLGFKEISREHDGSTHWLLDTAEAWKPHPVFIQKLGIDVQR